MLTLNDIVKDYSMGDETVHALRGVSLHFRPHEFVAILGPSGCGKTTLLNIIGGLDHYTSGDLVIGGVSTKQYKDKDWDSYRNHRVGFVFQSYNLIPHQTVLSNVELALTLSGVSRKERHARAVEALENVGLHGQEKKKPNQMSGGQMQRVAIARALVNDPDIILADEPTGALDTATSVQIMDILRSISDKKLIVMVTHNPEIAEEYATRIIRVKDGEVIEDTNPYDGVSEEPVEEVAEATVADVAEETVEEDACVAAKTPCKKKKAKKEKTSMSPLTAFSLSLNNLLTKKTRTILTSFAGSIGIIGIALILALSNGIQNFIDQVQRDTLSSYPIQIEESSMDLNSLMSSVLGTSGNKEKVPDGYIYSETVFSEMLKTMMEGTHVNDLASFREYIESDESSIKNNADVLYQYAVDPQAYYKLAKEDGTYKYVGANPSDVFDYLMALMGMSASGSNTSSIWSEMINNDELIHNQYKLLDGNWPTEYNEVLLVADKNHRISDIALYALGFKDPAEILAVVNGMLGGGTPGAGTPGAGTPGTGTPGTTPPILNTETDKFTFGELIGREFKMVLSADYYKDNGDGTYTDIRQLPGKTELNTLLDNTTSTIKIVGIIAPNPDATSTSISGTIAYTHKLTEHIMTATQATNEDGTPVYPIVKKQMDNKDVDAITGLPFEADDLEHSYKGNCELLGIADKDHPSAIYLYPKSFEAKDAIQAEIAAYNKNNDEDKEISYNDLVGIMMSSISIILDVITYVLVGFVSVSLIVSSIMIGIITYISVLERIKEIGILRAIGASKGNVSQVFLAETLIVGFVAGVLGIGTTLLLCIPTNLIIRSLSGINNISAAVPAAAVFILIGISMFLTLIAGLLPAMIAAKKEPVDALRSE